MSEHLSAATFERFDELDRTARASAVEHASRCVACRDRLVATDPTRAFALLAAIPIPPERLDRLDADLGREIDRLSQRRVGISGRAVAFIAASVALAAVVAGLVGERDRAAPAPRADRGSEAADAGPAYGRVELLSLSGDAQVLDLHVGGTQVVMIFDKDLDL